MLGGGAGSDLLDGGVGIDTANYGDAGGALTAPLSINLLGLITVTLGVGDIFGVVVDLSRTTAQQTYTSGVDTLTSIENVSGSALDDLLSGDAGGNALYGRTGDDTLSGADGNDTLVGSDGDDVIFGGAGADSIVGGVGLDEMRGNAGADVFVFQQLETPGIVFLDRIIDFDRTVDRIDLSAIDANSGLAGDQAFSFVGSFTGQAGQITRSYEFLLGRTVLRVDADGDGAGDDLVFQVNGNLSSGTEGFIL